MKFLSKKLRKDVAGNKTSLSSIVRFTIAEHFDASWYAASYPSVLESHINPLDHFLEYGLRANFKPNSEFDPQWYLAQYPDVARAEANPFIHFITHGLNEGRLPNSQAAAQFSSDASSLKNFDKTAQKLKLDLSSERNKLERQVDLQWYARTYLANSIKRQDPKKHFVEFGMQKGFIPNPFYDENWYLDNYKDVAASGMRPLIHYMTYGWREGRSPGPHFNPKVYLSVRPELKATATEPLAHYIAQDSQNATLHLQLGHAYRRSGLTSHAAFSYQKAFELKSLQGAAAALRSMGIAIDGIVKNRKTNETCLWLEVGDLPKVMQSATVVSGIQRVQFELISTVLREGAFSPAISVKFATWADNELWELPAANLQNLIENYKAFNDDFKTQQRLALEVVENAFPASVQPGDILLSTGVVYYHGDLTEGRARLRRFGMYLGMILYDFIPLSNPEFCHPDLISQFSSAISETLRQIDFALPISEFVAAEASRLMKQSGYGDIPIKGVPLAQCSDQNLNAKLKENWTGKIAVLQSSEFILSVSSLMPHKNQIFLINLWSLLLKSNEKIPKLVLVGRRAFGVEHIFNALAWSENLSEHVIHIDGPSDVELETLYQNCLFTMCPSFVEGWGLPVSESLARGKLCIASRSTALPEAGGDLALYFDPYNVREAEKIVRHLLENRKELRDLEVRVQSGFVERSWKEYSADLQSKAIELADFLKEKPDIRNPGPQFPLRKMVGMGTRKVAERVSTRLPPADRIDERLLLKTLIVKSSASSVFLINKLNDHIINLIVPVGLSEGTSVRLAFRFEISKTLSGIPIRIRVDGGDERICFTPINYFSDCLIVADGVVSSPGEIRVEIESSYATDLKLASLGCWPVGQADDVLEPLAAVHPTALIGPHGSAIPSRSLHAIERSMQRRMILRSGWVEPENWGAWIGGRMATIAFRVPESKRATTWRVIIRLRVSPDANDITVSVASGTTKSSTPTDRLVGSSMLMSLACQSDSSGWIKLLVEISSNKTQGKNTCLIGLESLMYADVKTDSEEAYFLRTAIESFNNNAFDDESIARDQLKINIFGHVNGSYSLANVNRRLSLALDVVDPGKSCLTQVENGQVIRDLDQVPVNQRSKISEMIDRVPDANGLNVSISQHWPIWKPEYSTDIAVAYTFWEESSVPPAMVAELNDNFTAVLTPSRFVTKVLRDCGVRLPIRQIGFAPDLKDFLDVGEQRAARVRTLEGRKVQFLHVSSCFPRKGADLLIQAYCETFDAEDPVELVIKTFPNPHNDVISNVNKFQAAKHNFPDIKVINDEMSSSTLLELYAKADVMVLPTRGEGFNIPAAEAMAAGLSLIVTGSGAHLDFVQKEFARLINYSFAPSRSHLKSSGSVWVEPDLQDLKIALRDAAQVHLSYDDTQLKHNNSLGRTSALKLSNGVNWANRVREAAYNLLSNRIFLPVKVAWISTWDVRCGISEYSRMLLDEYPRSADQVVVLCDDRTKTSALKISGQPEVRRVWRPLDGSSVDRIANEIELIGASAVVIQHQPGLISWGDLARIIRHPKLQSCTVLVQLHSVQQILSLEESECDDALRALSTVSRVLVHGVNDINLLNTRGQLENITLLPHGAMRPPLPSRVPRCLNRVQAPLIGTYGFMLPHKGFQELIQAFALLRGKWPGIRLRMVTSEYPIAVSSEMLDECKNLANSLNVFESIEWHTDYLPTFESLTLLNECDLIVLPYQHTKESSSAAARTALASLSPVAVTPLKIFDDIEGSVARLGGIDPESIESGVNWLIGNVAARNDIQREATDWLKHNSWDVIGMRLHGLIEGLGTDHFT